MSGPFDTHVDRYDAWFDRHRAAYVSEVTALRELLPEDGEGVEIGVGTGRFAAALGVRYGIEPAAGMRERALARGVTVVEGVAEDMPFEDDRFGYALMVTTVCFLDDVQKAFREVYRVLKPGGTFVVGHINPESPLGRRYEERKTQSIFYRRARFYTTHEIVEAMEAAGFSDLAYRQTLFRDPELMEEPDPVREGYGEGAFIVIRGRK